MDQAQLQSVFRTLLVTIGAGLAGTWLAPYFTADTITMAASCAAIIAAGIWGHQSNTPVALAQKLVSNTAVDNIQAGQAIMAGKPETVRTKP